MAKKSVQTLIWLPIDGHRGIFVDVMHADNSAAEPAVIRNVSAMTPQRTSGL
jgi:hypothetical protein